ncbi:permease [Acholeplasma oculi]|nr:permease [Acholeplasma oculi]
MKWLEEFIYWLFKDVFGMNEHDLMFDAITFFFYDVIKIFILLSVLIFITSYIQSYFTPERTRKILGSMKGIQGNIVGALLGTVTPFCSCSSIPIFIAFTRSGLPLGVTFSFLISSPLVDIASIILLTSIFGYEVALLYVVVGLLIAVIGGFIIGLLKMDDQIEEFARFDINEHYELQEDEKMSQKERSRYALNEVKNIIKKVYLYVFIGVGIGALIHGYIPTSWILAVLGDNNPFSVIIATLISIPIYADIFGTLPIAEALLLKGVGLGTVLSFMMAVTALSLPSILMLKRVVKPKLLVTFISIVTISIIIMGYIFNFYQFIF